MYAQGTDHLTVTWKVEENILHHIDIREEGKPNQFSLGKSLWIGTDVSVCVCVCVFVCVCVHVHHVYIHVCACTSYVYFSCGRVYRTHDIHVHIGATQL